MRTFNSTLQSLMESDWDDDPNDLSSSHDNDYYHFGDAYNVDALRTLKHYTNADGQQVLILDDPATYSGAWDLTGVDDPARTIMTLMAPIKGVKREVGLIGNQIYRYSEGNAADPDTPNQQTPAIKLVGPCDIEPYHLQRILSGRARLFMGQKQRKHVQQLDSTSFRLTKPTDPGTTIGGIGHYVASIIDNEGRSEIATCQWDDDDQAFVFTLSFYINELLSAFEYELTPAEATSLINCFVNFMQQIYHKYPPDWKRTNSMRGYVVTPNLDATDIHQDVLTDELHKHFKHLDETLWWINDVYEFTGRLAPS